MSIKELTLTNQKPSKLERFTIGFEFNETWADARKKYTTSKR
jgi:hypothetical protein